MSDEVYVRKEVWDVQCEQINTSLSDIKAILRPVVTMVTEDHQRLNDHIALRKDRWPLSQILITAIMALIAIGMLIVTIVK